MITFNYRFPYAITAGTVTQLASGRPFSATTGIDNNGDGINNDRPVIDGVVTGRSSFRSTPTSDVSAFVEKRFPLTMGALMVRLEAFNLFNTVNILGRGVTVYGDTGTPAPTFGQLVAVGTSAVGLPALANIDPSRSFQFQIRYQF